MEKYIGNRNHSPVSQKRIEHSRVLRPFFPSYLVLSLLAVIALARLARRKPYSDLDLTLERRFQSFRAPWFDHLMHAVSYLGRPPQANVILGGIIPLLYLLGYKSDAGVETVLVAGDVAVFSILIFLIRRPRPTPDLVRVSTSISLPGFPSGHVINFTSMIGYLWLRIYGANRHPFLRALGLVLLGGLVVLIGPSRIYTGEHWPSDVLAGYLIGATWLSIVLRRYRRG